MSSVVTGLVHRIVRACSACEYFHASLERAKKVLRNNQHPTNLYEPLIHSTIEKLHLPQRSNEAEEEEVKEVPKHLLFVVSFAVSTLPGVLCWSNRPRPTSTSLIQTALSTPQPFEKNIRLCGASHVFDGKKDVSILHISTRSIPYHSS